MTKASQSFVLAAQLPMRQEKGQQWASGTTTHQTETQYFYTINAHGHTLLVAWITLSLENDCIYIILTAQEILHYMVSVVV